MMPEDEYLPQRTLHLCKNRYFRVFMENILLTSEMCSFDVAQTNKQKQTNPFNFFHMTLPSVEGIFEQVILIGQFGHTPFLSSQIFEKTSFFTPKRLFSTARVENQIFNENVLLTFDL